MVQADPFANDLERVDDLEERVFCGQQEKIREHYDWSKNLCMQLTEKSSQLAQQNLDTALSYKRKISTLRMQLKIMFKKDRVSPE